VQPVLVAGGTPAANGLRTGIWRFTPLRTSNLQGAEISFLLGFKDPNSFFRAYRNWTCQTPEQARGAMQEM
jgi:hypothetical protein